jgi:transcriptional regulator with XRE-family HTH domain
MIRAGMGSYQALADKMGCSRQWLSVMLNRGSGAVNTVQRLAEALGVDVATIIKED